MSISVIDVATQAYQCQKPGTSGLRKKVTIFEQPNYTENFIQSILEATRPKFLVVGGDGRYYLDEAIKKIINICAANGIEHLVIPKGGILSTPAASALIRKLGADGGIILTASHNPGGKDGDFGIKYNIKNGGPAPESVTNKIYDISKSLSSYKSLLKRPQIDLQEEHIFTVANMKVEVIDPVDNYVKLMRETFDFDEIQSFICKKPLKMKADAMSGVVGPYINRVLVEELGASKDCLLNAEPLPDFGGKHPDPNLTYASSLVASLKEDSSIDFGVAFDGDGDRNMILGKEAFFVTPGDSLAVIAAHLKGTGFARSFPTSPAVDRVAEHFGLKCYETPTGWKFFGNLMDSNLISICGEESFGTGSNHIREKDGLWACLAWLSIMAKTGKTVEELVVEHWKHYGRDYFCRYDFEDCEASKCQAMIKELETVFKSKSLFGKTYGSKSQYTIKETGNFDYVDPVDKSITTGQGLFVKFQNGARIIVRLSGTGSSGATVRLYVSDFSKDDIMQDSQEYLKDLLDIAYSISKLPEYTGREKPTVIT